MKFARYIFTLIFLLIFINVFAHQDFMITKDFGNVKVRIKTGFEYEEISKVLMIGKLAEQFSKQLNYNSIIFLDFNHHYIGNCEPDYFISYDKGKIQQSFNGADKEKDVLKDKSIVVRQVSRQFDAEISLKLLAYAIQNIDQIKSTQKEIEYNKNYCQWIINSVDTLINEMLLQQPSNEVKSALAWKIENCKNDFKYGFSYFLKDNKYSIFLREYNKEDNVILKLDNVYDLKNLGNSSMIFDTDSTFYFIDQHQNKVSKRQVIKNKHGYYMPYIIENFGTDKISIKFSNYSNKLYNQAKNRTLIYLINKDELTEELN